MISADFTVEESLRRVEDRVAMLRFFGDSIRQVDVVPEGAFFSGLADSLEEIEAAIRAVRKVLDVDALGTQIGSGQHRPARRGRRS